MAKLVDHLSFSTEENQILLNPKWPGTDFQSLKGLADWAEIKQKLQKHVWIATSGSTANSIAATKLVALSIEAVKASARTVNAHLKSSEHDIWAQILPSFHVGGMGVEVRAKLSGAKVVRAFQNERWDVDFYYQTLRDQSCTLSALVPTQVYDLILKKYPAPKALRAVIVGGGAFDINLYQEARSLGWPVLPSYGMTETSSQIATASLKSLNDSQHPEMTLLDHAKARQNSEGFLEVWAESLFTCYAQNTPQGPKVWDPKKMSWFTTEDRGEVRGESLIIQGRGKDYIKIGGEGSNLLKLRSVLESCAAQLDKRWPHAMTLLDMPSDRLGSEIHLVSTLGENESQKVAQLFSEQVLPFEKARKIHYVDEIPRNDLGKILWAELRRKL